MHFICLYDFQTKRLIALIPIFQYLIFTEININFTYTPILIHPIICFYMYFSSIPIYNIGYCEFFICIF